MVKYIHAEAWSVLARLHCMEMLQRSVQVPCSQSSKCTRKQKASTASGLSATVCSAVPQILVVAPEHLHSVDRDRQACPSIALSHPTIKY